MDDQNNGRSFLIPGDRRLTWDLLWFNKAVPLCGHDRLCNLSRLAAARSAAPVRISWPALFVKAYALVAKQYPELRQVWYRWPWAHIYQHPHSVGVVTIQREHKNRPWLFWGRLHEPEKMSLVEIQEQIDHYATVSPRQVFRDELKLASLPTVVRRILWGWNIHVAKRRRATRLGTFFLSTLAGKGVEIQIPPSIHTGCLTYGPINDNGLMRVTLAYDHRVMDGSLVASILTSLEAVLLQSVYTELLHQGDANARIKDVA